MRALLGVVAIAAVVAGGLSAHAQYQSPDARYQNQYQSPYNQAQNQGQNQGQNQAQAQIPPGTYRNSCTNIYVTGAGQNARLTATCRDIAGRQTISTLAWRGCIGDVGNNNGMLACAGGPVAVRGGPQQENRPQPAPARLPTGSWVQTCIRGQIDGMSFTAQCLDPSNRRVYAEVSVRNCPSYSYSNVQGRLVCDDDLYNQGRGRGGRGGRGERDPDYGQFPRGPWRQTCQDATVNDGYILSARCRNNRGNWQPSTIDVRACRRPAVINDNGTLRCE